MVATRRVYVYLLAFAGLAVLAGSVASLGRALLGAGLGTIPFTNATYVREEIARGAAGAVVGLLVWLGHWWWAQRLVDGAGTAGLAERASTLRRLYLYATLALATIAGTVAATNVVQGLMGSLERSTLAPARQSAQDLPWVLVMGVVVLFHARVARGDASRVGETGGSATLRRWYVYGGAFLGLMLLLDGARTLLEGVWRSLLPGVVAGGSVGFLRDGAPPALVGLGLWLYHWRILAGRLEQRDEEVRSTLRSVYLFLGLAAAVAGTLIGVSRLLYYAVGRILGVERPGGVGGDLAQAASGPASVALAYGAGWLYQRAVVREHARDPRADAPRQVGVRRLYTYLVALVAMAALAWGLGGQAWTVVDLLSGAATPAGSGGDWWRERVALYATLILVALPVWIAHWRLHGGARDGGAEARSLARRLYLYLTLIGSMLAVLVGAANALFRLLNLALGERASVSLASELGHWGAVAVVAGAVAAYHWYAVRLDSAVPVPVPTVSDEIETQASAAPASVLVRLSATDAAAIEQALAAVRQRGVQAEVFEAPTPGG